MAYHKVVGETLHLRLSATTTGWIGFGIAEFTSGSMKGGDMVTAYVDSAGTVHADDRYAGWAANQYNVNTGDVDMPDLQAIKDVHNDWTVVTGSEADGTTAVYLTRPLNTSDTQDRIIIAGQRTRIIYAWGSSDTVAYHGKAQRGVGMTTFGAADAPPAITTTDYQEFKINPYNIPAMGTAYSCQSFVIDGPGQEVHAVAFEPVFTEATKKNVHHLIVHMCKNNDYHASHSVPQLCGSVHHGGDEAVGDGRSPSNSADNGDCEEIIWAWAAGAGNFILPAQAGFRVGNTQTNTNSHIVLEIHYDNPTLSSVLTDEVGFRMYYETTFRAYDAGILNVGDPFVRAGNNVHASSLPSGFEMGALPKDQAAVIRQGTCPKECTETLTDDHSGNEPMNVFFTFHHMHYTGHKIALEHRDGQGNLLHTHLRQNFIDNWDNGFQNALTFDHASNEFVINEGDSLQTICSFDTTRVIGRNEVHFGSGTPDEMCMHFLAYYPKKKRGGEPFTHCGMMTNDVPGSSSDDALLTLCGSLKQPAHSSGDATGYPGAFLWGGSLAGNDYNSYQIGSTMPEAPYESDFSTAPDPTKLGARP